MGRTVRTEPQCLYKGHFTFFYNKNSVFQFHTFITSQQMSLKIGHNNIPPSPSRPIKQSFPKYPPPPLHSFDFLSPNIGLTWTARFSRIWKFPGMNLSLVARGIPFYAGIS
jgi:hypothetical protein